MTTNYVTLGDLAINSSGCKAPDPKPKNVGGFACVVPPLDNTQTKHTLTTGYGVTRIGPTRDNFTPSPKCNC